MALNNKLDIANYIPQTPQTAETLGLGNVDNTSDLNKPISTAAQAESDTKLDIADYVPVVAAENSVSNNTFDINTLLPGIPVTDAVRAYVPSYKTTTLNSSGRVLELTNPLSDGGKLNYYFSESAYNIPIYKTDKLGRPYIRFGDSQLVDYDTSIENIGGATGQTSTIILVANIDIITGDDLNVPFNWVKGTTRPYDTAVQLNAHLPFNDTYYVDYMNKTEGNGRLKAVLAYPVTDTISIFYYERDGSNAELWLNGKSIGSATTLSTAVTNDRGRFTLGGDSTGDSNIPMDFYALLFYPRALTEDEKYKLMEYLKEEYITKEEEENIKKLLPGLPVEGLSMAYVADPLTTKIDLDYNVYAIKDLVSGISLVQPDTNLYLALT